MHVHTNCSPDSLSSEKDVISACMKRGLSGVAITDHNTIRGALAAKKSAPPGFTIIIGEEIQTRDGEIIGYFLEENIPPHLPAEETVKRIKAQGGLVGIPHPFGSFRQTRLKEETLEKIVGKADIIIETFNSRNICKRDDQKALNLARKNGTAQVAGSDAHLSSEIGRSFIEVDDFNTTQEFLRNLYSAKLITNRSSFRVHMVTILVKLFRKLRR